MIINLGWLGNQVIDYVGSGEKFGIKVIYSPEENQILETGGGIVRALPMLGKEPFWVINADIYTDYELPIIDLKPNILGHLVLVKNPKYRLSGDFNLKGLCHIHSPVWLFMIQSYFPTKVLEDFQLSLSYLTRLIRNLYLEVFIMDLGMILELPKDLRS